LLRPIRRITNQQADFRQRTTQAVRAVFIIDPVGKVRAMLYYPLSNGRNMRRLADPIERLIQDNISIALLTTPSLGLL
jgi:alkyl hydroperoxide reductase subunit AhpC